MESVTNTEDMPCNVLIFAFIVNVSLKSRVREIRKHGSVGVTITRTLILGTCYGFYPTKEDDVNSGVDMSAYSTLSRFKFYETHEYLDLNEFFDSGYEWQLDNESLPSPYVIPIAIINAVA